MERKRVAVFLSTPYGDMVRETTEGVIDVARRNGAKLLFFTSFAHTTTATWTMTPVISWSTCCPT